MPDPTAGESFGNMLLDVFRAPRDRVLRPFGAGMIYAAAKGEGVEGILTRFLRGSPIAAAVEFATGADWHDNISGEEMMKALGVENQGSSSRRSGPSLRVRPRSSGLALSRSSGRRSAQVRFTRRRAGLCGRRGRSDAVAPRQGVVAARHARGDRVGWRSGRRSRPVVASVAVGAGEDRRAWYRVSAFTTRFCSPRRTSTSRSTAAETMWEGMARTKLAQAVRPMVSVLPIIGKGFSSADDSTIAATKVAENLMKTEFGERAGLAAGYAEMIDRGLGTIVKNTPEELEPFIASFKELGLDTIDAIRDPEKVAAAYSQRIAKLFGFSDEAKTEALKQSLLARITAGTIDDPDSVKSRG